MDKDLSTDLTTKRKFTQIQDEEKFQPNKKIKTDDNNCKEVNVSFSDLPPEIRLCILSFITDDSQRRHIRLVCQLWFHDVNYNEFRIGLLLASEVEQFSRCFGRYITPIGIKFMKLDYSKDISTPSNKQFMSAEHFKQAIRNLTQLTALDLGIKDFELPGELVNIQSLTIACPLHPHNIAKLTNLTRLETSGSFDRAPTTLVSLIFDENSLFTASFDIDHTKLTELSISINKKVLPDVPLSLKKLCINYTNSFHVPAREPIDTTQILSNLNELYTNIPAPMLYRSTLTKLTYLNPVIKKIKIDENLTQLKELYCTNINMNNNNLRQLESCIILDHKSDATIVQHLDPNKVTRLKTTFTDNNYNVFAKFDRLVDLDLYIPTTSFAPSTDLKLLTRLRLLYSKLPRDWMNGLPNLENISLEKAFTAVPEVLHFQSMSNLTSIQLFGHYQSINIDSLTKLEQLEIDNNNDSFMMGLEIRGISTATNLTRLIFLHRDMHQQYQLINYKDIAPLTKLRELCAQQTLNKPVDLATLTHFQHLTYLDVHATKESVSYLTKLSRLQRLDLQTSSEVDTKSLLNALPFCNYFYEKSLYFE